MINSISRSFAAGLLLLLPPALSGQSSAEFDAVAARYGLIQTVAGTGFLDDCNDWNAVMEGGNATAADLSRPHNAVADAAGNIYIADKEGHAIRKVDLEGRIHTVAGNGIFAPPTGTDRATETSLWAPNGVFVFPDGTFYFLTVNDDCENKIVNAGGRIHRVTPDGTLTTLVVDPALFIGRGLYVTPDQSTIYYSSNTVFNRWNSNDGITTLATGFSSLGNIDREASGSFLVTDRSGSRVWRVQTDGTKSVVAGTGGTSGGGNGQLATDTGLNQVRGVAVVDTGGYFLCTHRGHQVWYVDSAGYIWNFINDGTKAHSGDGLPATHGDVHISEPRNITLAPNGDLLITEHDSGYIRRVTNITTKPRILAIDYDSANGATIEWTSHREATYFVCRSTNLEDWTPSAPVPGGSGSRTSFTDPDTSDLRAFYQVAEVLEVAN